MTLFSYVYKLSDFGFDISTVMSVEYSVFKISMELSVPCRL